MGKHLVGVCIVGPDAHGRFGQAGDPGGHAIVRLGISAQTSPIAIDFGSSSVKLLQITPGEKPSILGAVGLRIPDAIRLDQDMRLDYFEKQLPRMLRKGGLKGRRVICSIPCADSIIQHMQIVNTDGIDEEETVKLQLASQQKIAAHNMVVRTYHVAEVHPLKVTPMCSDLPTRKYNGPLTG